MLYSGLAGDDATHEKGVALILSKEARKSLKEWSQSPGRLSLLGSSLSVRILKSSKSINQQTTLRRKRRRTFTTNFNPPSTRERQEISGYW